MELDVQHNRNSVLFVLSGEVTHSDGDILRDSAQKEITANADFVWILMRDVSFIDSVGLGVLMGFKMLANTAKAKVSLLDPSKRVLDTLRLAKFDKVFEIFQGPDADDILRDRCGYDSPPS